MAKTKKNVLLFETLSFTTDSSVNSGPLWVYSRFSTSDWSEQNVWSRDRQHVVISCSLHRQGKCSSLYLLNNLHANLHKLTIKWPTCWIFLFICLLSLSSEITSHYLAFFHRFTLDAWKSTWTFSLLICAIWIFCFINFSSVQSIFSICHARFSLKQLSVSTPRAC